MPDAKWSLDILWTFFPFVGNYVGNFVEFLVNATSEGDPSGSSGSTKFPIKFSTKGPKWERLTTNMSKLQTKGVILCSSRQASAPFGSGKQLASLLSPSLFRAKTESFARTHVLSAAKTVGRSMEMDESMDRMSEDSEPAMTQDRCLAWPPPSWLSPSTK
jgi:hypothetical protein